MDITPLIPKDRQVITHYGNGGFTVNAVAHKGNILITPENVGSWAVQAFTDATVESFSPLLAGELPEILLIGTGTRFAPLSEKLRGWFREKGISVDVMDTGAACRTYSILLVEGRSVAAALIAV